MADFQKIKAMSRKEKEELFLNFEILFTTVNGLFSNSKGEEHKAYSRVLDVISDIAIKRELEPYRIKIVRCKDCKYFQTAKVNNKGFLICPTSGMEITETDYCSYGEK